MNKIIKKIEKLRLNRGWTNYRLSAETGIATATILNWYKNNAIPKYEAIEAVCVAYGLTLSEFYNFDNEVYYPTQNQKELLSEYDQLNKDEKEALLHFIKTLNVTRKKFLNS